MRQEFHHRNDDSRDSNCAGKQHPEPHDVVVFSTHFQHAAHGAASVSRVRTPLDMCWRDQVAARTPHFFRYDRFSDCLFLLLESCWRTHRDSLATDAALIHTIHDQRTPLKCARSAGTTAPPASQVQCPASAGRQQGRPAAEPAGRGAHRGTDARQIGKTFGRRPEGVHRVSVLGLRAASLAEERTWGQRVYMEWQRGDGSFLECGSVRSGLRHG